MRSVSMRPGATQFTVIPFGPSSRASDFAQPTTPGRIDVREREVVDRLANGARRDVDDAAGRASLEVRKAEARQPDDRDEQELHRGLHLLGVELGGGRTRRAARVVDEDVDASVRVDGRLHEPLEVVGARHVADDGEAADPLGLALDELAAAREQDDVRALAGERLGDAEPDARRRAADDGRAAGEPEIHRYFFFRTPTTSRTAAADARSILFSSAVRRSFTISSTPPAPSLTGTPM